MAKRNKRKQKITVFGSVEGHREEVFINFLTIIYKPNDNNINFRAINNDKKSGGSPDSIVLSAIKECHRHKTFAWFDEDFEPHNPLTEALRQKLFVSWKLTEAVRNELFECPMKDLQSSFNSGKENPVLIVSQPVCSESLILRTLGKSLPYPKYIPNNRKVQIKGLKDTLNKLSGKSQEEQLVFYQKTLTKSKLEAARQKIPELDLLISMLTN